MSGTDGPVRIAHVITRLDVGGAQETVLRIAEGLDRSRFEPVIIAGSDPGSGGSLRARAAAAGIDVIDVRSLVGPVSPLADAAAVAGVARELKERRVALVHTHSSKGGVVGRIAARVAHVPAVHMVHGWSFNDAQRLPVRRGYITIERILARLATRRLLVVTSLDEEVGLQHGIGTPSCYRIVRSGIELCGSPQEADLDRIRSEVRDELGLPADAYVVVSVGRLEPQKDPLTLVEGFACAFGPDPAVALVLIGGGSLRERVGERARELSIGSSVHCLGLRDDVRRLLVAADVFALTSRWEGLPRVVLEAMDVGTPVLATDVGGTSEVVRDGRTGVLVTPGSPAEVGVGLRRLWAAPRDAAQLADRARVQLPEFSVGSMVDRVQEVYCEVLTEDVGQ